VHFEVRSKFVESTNDLFSTIVRSQQRNFTTSKKLIITGGQAAEGIMVPA